MFNKSIIRPCVFSKASAITLILWLAFYSFLKLVHIFSVNPHLGPLQISLGRMIIDIIKFFFIYTLVLCAFGCGNNNNNNNITIVLVVDTLNDNF